MAGFVPEHDDVQALLYRISSQVARVFQEAETRILAEAARRLARDLPELDNLTAVLAAVRELEAYARAATEGITRELAEEVIARAMRAGAASVADLPTVGALSTLTDQHVLAAALMAFDLGNAFDDMRARILRYPRDLLGQFMPGGDIYQQVIANNAAQVPLGLSTSDARKAAVVEFLERGVTGFTDVAGRNWRIGTYAEMATRTAVGRAYTDATVSTSLANDVDLFTVLGGANACSHCAPWFGKIVAASGSAGPREVLHSFEDRSIVVDVAGTIDAWRTSGANHPNCLCRLTPYLPGFTIPVSASAYDPEAHAARDRLRELERRERDAKRKQLIAEAAGDDARAKRQRRRVLDTQAETREHVRETGQTRRYERAQPGYADGYGGTGGQRGEFVLPPIPPGSRVAPFVPASEWKNLAPHELDTAQRLADVGFKVRFQEVVNGYKVSNIDTTIDGVPWELKSPEGDGKNTIWNQIRRAKKQGAKHIVIDGTRTPLSDEHVLGEMRRRLADSEWFERMIHIAKDGTVTVLTRR